METGRDTRVGRPLAEVRRGRGFPTLPTPAGPGHAPCQPGYAPGPPKDTQTRLGSGSSGFIGTNKTGHKRGGSAGLGGWVGGHKGRVGRARRTRRTGRSGETWQEEARGVRAGWSGA